jgi:hypothetical protein
MAKRKDIAKGAKASQFVLGSDHFAKISEVEGIRLTTAMKQRASEAQIKDLSAEEYRRTIIRSYRNGVGTPYRLPFVVPALRRDP